MRRALFGSSIGVRHIAHASNPAGSDEPPREEKNMHPGMMHWWRSRHAAREYAVHAGCGSMAHGAYWAAPPDHGDLGAGAFGVRRPLRYLAYKLGLDEQQVAELARILNELKTERAQAEVDGRRAVTALADAIAGEVFDHQKGTECTTPPVRCRMPFPNVPSQLLSLIVVLPTPLPRIPLASLSRSRTLS